MTNDSTKDLKVQYLSNNSVKLPEFINQDDDLIEEKECA